eukprot:TRINITY_DN94084_c0_g1_i1.p1 TRINITY_DN94084_c0_g1~~TRINITY_DN94084_c0_g1_i1.p1  ORF type:complete len:168 (+),score=56.10 TRINITY_DN94084_c0_g1_i1:105-608(+)
MSAQVLNLQEFLDPSTLECLNQDKAHPVENVFKPEKEFFLASCEDVDHQLLIRVAFRQPVKLHSVVIKGNSEDESAPQAVKIFQGKDHLGFSEAETDCCSQVLDMTPEQVDKGEQVPLRFVKFQNVSSLQIFIENNFGAPVTRIEGIEFWGQTAEKMDMKEFKPIKG